MDMVEAFLTEIEFWNDMLCNQTEQDRKKLKSEISDWLALIIDTYEEVKKVTTQNQEAS